MLPLQLTPSNQNVLQQAFPFAKYLSFVTMPAFPPSSIHVIYAWIICFITGAFALLANPIDNLIPRDPAFKLPQPSRSQQGCSSCGNRATDYRLDLVEDDKAISSINLNMYGPDEFVRDVLVLEHGHRGFQWNPDSVYTLVPKGRKGTTNEITAFLQRVIVIFRISRNEETGEIDIRCISDPRIKISRFDNRIRITLGGGSEYDFEADDIFGQSWRLAGLSHASSNWQTAFEYNEQSKMTGVIYPNGQRAELSYEGDFLVKIAYPSGAFVTLGRDVGGYVSTLEFYQAGEVSKRQELVRYTSYTDQHGQEQTKAVYRTVTDQGEPTLIKRYLYENDAHGRIVRYINPCSKSTRVEFTNHLDEEGIRELAIIATEENTGDYYFMRQRVVDNQRSWVIDKGYGHAGQALQDEGRYKVW